MVYPSAQPVVVFPSGADLWWLLSLSPFCTAGLSPDKHVHSLFLSGAIMFLPDKFSYISSKKLFLSYWTGVKIADFYVSLSKHNNSSLFFPVPKRPWQ